MATLIKNIKLDFTAKGMKTSSSVKTSNAELGRIDFYYNTNREIGEYWNDNCRFIATVGDNDNWIIRRFGSDIIVADLPSNHPAIVQLCKNAENPIESVKKVMVSDLKFSRMMKQCDRIDEQFEALRTNEGFGVFDDPCYYFDPENWAR